MTRNAGRLDTVAGMGASRVMPEPIAGAARVRRMVAWLRAPRRRRVRMPAGPACWTVGIADGTVSVTKPGDPVVALK